MGFHTNENQNLGHRDHRVHRVFFSVLSVYSVTILRGIHH